MPSFERVPLKHCFIDSDYQRDFDERHVAKMRKDFDPALLGALEGSRRSAKRVAIFDGQHRLRLLEDLTFEDAPVLVHEGLSPGQEADLFRRLQDGRKQLQPLDRFKARLHADPPDPAAREIDAIAGSLGLKIGWGAKNGELSAIVVAERVYRRGNLRETLGIITRLWRGEKSALEGSMIDGTSRFLYLYPEADMERIEDKWSEVAPIVVTRKAEQYLHNAHSSKSLGVLQALRDQYTNTQNRLPSVESAMAEKKVIEEQNQRRYKRINPSDVREAARELKMFTPEVLAKHMSISKSAALSFIKELTKLDLLAQKRVTRDTPTEGTAIEGLTPGKMYYTYVPITERKTGTDPRSRPREPRPEDQVRVTNGNGRGKSVTGTGRGQKATHPEIRALIQELQNTGAVAKLTPSGHWEIVKPGCKRITLPNTPGNSRSVLNARSRARREGYLA